MKSNWYDIMREAYISDQIAADIRAQGNDIVQAYQEPFDNLKQVLGEKGANLFDGQGGINGSALGEMSLDEFKQFEQDLQNVNPEDLFNMGFGNEEMLSDNIIDESEVAQL